MKSKSGAFQKMRSMGRHEDIVSILNAMVPMVVKEVGHMPLTFWTESIFRYFFVRALRIVNAKISAEVEWWRIDLMIRSECGPVLVEFKFYTTRELNDFQGHPIRNKGGPSKDNFADFCKCVLDLALVDATHWHSEEDMEIAGRYIILAYSDADGVIGRKSYSHWYDSVAEREEIKSLARVRSLIQPLKLRCEASKRTLIFQLLEVEPFERSS